LTFREQTAKRTEHSLDGLPSVPDAGNHPARSVIANADEAATIVAD